MKELNICPSTLQEGYNTYCPSALKALFDGRTVSHIFSEPSPDSETEEANNTIKSVGRISISGAQPKFAVKVENDKLCYVREGEKGGFILKPRPTGYNIINKDFCAANEHLTMQIASQVYGIETAANALCFFSGGSPAYITRRFDMHSGGKYKQEDFAALLGYTKDNAGENYKYAKASYEECAQIISRYVKAAPVDILRFFRLILFNFITLNDDAHLKNFSLIEGKGEYRLSPAYDLINTSLQLREPRIFALDKGLFQEGMKFTDTTYIGRLQFEEFGRRIGLSEKLVKKQIDIFTSEQKKAKELIERSFLSPALKKQYWESFDYRRKMLNFKTI